MVLAAGLGGAGSSLQAVLLCCTQGCLQHGLIAALQPAKQLVPCSESSQPALHLAMTSGRWRCWQVMFPCHMSLLSFKGPCHVQELLWCLQWLRLLPITAHRIPNALLLAVWTHPQLSGFGSFLRWTPGDDHQWEEVAGDFQGWFPPYHHIALYFGGRVKIL